jgi:protein-tyrosine-phosphatase
MSEERKIPVIKMEGATYEEAVTANREQLSAAIVEAVEFAIETGAQEVEVFEVEELDLVFSLTRSEMKTALNGCLGYYESVEDYFTCTKIVNLKTNI